MSKKSSVWNLNYLGCCLYLDQHLRKGHRRPSRPFFPQYWNLPPLFPTSSLQSWLGVLSRFTCPCICPSRVLSKIFQVVTVLTQLCPRVVSCCIGGHLSAGSSGRQARLSQRCYSGCLPATGSNLFDTNQVVTNSQTQTTANGKLSGGNKKPNTIITLSHLKKSEITLGL